MKRRQTKDFAYNFIGEPKMLLDYDGNLLGNYVNRKIL